MIKTDLLTGEKFESNRSNQNFSNPQNRIKYYNGKAKYFRQKTAYINKPLHNNIRILDEIMKDKVEIVWHKQFLLGKGLSFGVHTHYEMHEGKQYRAIYQYIIVQLENEQIKIIRK